MAEGPTDVLQDTRETDRVRVMPVDGPNGNGHEAEPVAPDPVAAVPVDAVPVEVVVGEVQDTPEVQVSATLRVVPGPPDDEDDFEHDGGDDDGLLIGYDDRFAEALPELARLAATAWTRTAVWGVGAGLRVGARLARATVDPQSAAELAQGLGSGMRGYARELLGISELEDRIDALTPVGDRFAAPRSRELTRGEGREPRVAPEVALRAQGAELLRQSADVTVDDALHPAFGRILSELAPDEGRILRLLAQEGPQPVVDVRAASLIGVGSQLVAQNLNMVDMQAGCRHSERVPAYLINLQRLGLASFSDEPLDDAITYQVLEAQPHVLEAIQATSRAKSVQRSLRLTPFGTEFCQACFLAGPEPVPELAGGSPEGDPAAGEAPASDRDTGAAEDSSD